MKRLVTMTCAAALALGAGAEAAETAKVVELRYSEAIGAAGVGDLHYPARWTADTPVVLTIHGGGWMAMDRRSFEGVAAFFARDLGFAAFNVEYRLASEKTPWPACGDDCVAAARYLLSPAFAKASGLKPRQIYVVGASAGGHLALWTGLSLPSEQVAGIVSLSGIADPGPDRRANPSRYPFMVGAGRPEMSPLTLIRANGPRVLLTHATEDAVVPIASARNFEAAYRAAGNDVSLFEYPSATEPGLTGHFIWRPESNPHRLIALLESRIRRFMSVGAPFSASELAPANFDAACDRRMATWRAKAAVYRPDDSDSSAELLPTEGNRLERPFAVVRGGRPACEVVLSGELEGSCVRKAAEEFVRYVKEITGVELPIVEGAGRRNGLGKLCLGKRCVPRVQGLYAAPKFEAALERLSGRDGYAVMVEEGRPDRLYVFGACDKGTMNGVYALLENNTDIIWARPDESLGTVFSESPGELSFVWGRDVVSVPATRGRGWNGYKDVPWMARNGCNMFNAGGGGDIAYMNRLKDEYGVLYTRHMGGHNIGQFLRGVGRWTNVREGNPCFTSDDVLRAVTSNVLACARIAPDGTDKIYFNIHDTWKGCECARCLAPIRCADGTTLGPKDDAFRSTQFWLFMNEVGRALAQEFPRMSIVALAYFPTAAAPKCRLAPNVHPEFAPYVRVNDKTPIFSKENRFWLRRLADWSKAASEVEVYEYYGLGLHFPRPLAEVRAWDFTVMHPFVLGMSTEYNHNGDSPKNESPRRQWDASAIEFWTMCRLYWDPSQDVERLRKRFIRRAYREAAPEIERVYGTIRAAFFASDRASTLGDAPLELAKTLLVDAKRDVEIERLFAAALARKTLHPKSRLLVEALRARLMAQITEARNIKNPMLTVPLVRPDGGEAGFDSPVWEKGAQIASFARTGKARGEAAPVSTSARVFHDSDRLWLRVRCDDPKIAQLPVYQAPPNATESVPEADHVEVFVADVKDSSSYYLFSLTPDGLRGDLRGYDDSWNGAWTRQARRTADGWEAILAIPLATVGGDDATRALKVLVWRDYEPHGGAPRSYSSWGGGSPHQPVTFGDMTLMR